MALIKCPECGKDVSDKAKLCNNCGCPIEDLSPSGTVKIKLSFLKRQGGVNGKQKATIVADGKTLWEGQVGEIAHIYFEGETNVTIKYHTSMLHFGGECTGIVDPAKSKKYSIVTREGFLSTKLMLQPVDVFDAD